MDDIENLAREIKEKRDQQAKVLVFRNSASEPIAVPADVVTEGERAYRCHKMRLDGYSWEDIAIIEKYPSATSVKAEVDRYLKEGKALVMESSQRDMLSLEVARLDSMQLALWKKAQSGHVPSVNAVVNIIMNRAKLVGLDANRMNEQTNGPATLVVPVDDDGFLDALKIIAKNAVPQIKSKQEGPPAVPDVVRDEE